MLLFIDSEFFGIQRYHSVLCLAGLIVLWLTFQDQKGLMGLQGLTAFS